MNKKLLRISSFIVLFLAPFIAFSQSGGIDEAINNNFKPIADAWGSFVFYPVKIAGLDVPIVAVPNIIGCFFLFPKVREELNTYLAAIKAG